MAMPMHLESPAGHRIRAAGAVNDVGEVGDVSMTSMAWRHRAKRHIRLLSDDRIEATLGVRLAARLTGPARQPGTRTKAP